MNQISCSTNFTSIKFGKSIQKEQTAFRLEEKKYKNYRKKKNENSKEPDL